MTRKWLYIFGPVAAASVAAIVFGVPPVLSDYIPTSLGVYNSSPPTLTTGQAAPLQLDVNGQLKITGSVSVSGGTGTSAVDEAAFTAGSGSYTPFGGLYQTTSTSNPLTSGQAGVAQLTINRALHVNLRNLTGAETGVAALPLQVSLANTAANATPVSDNLAQINGHTTVEAGANGVLAVGGQTATNVAITENPGNLGAQAMSSENSAVTTARKVQLVATLTGKQIVQPYANPENFVNGTTAAITDTTSTSTIASAGGSLRNYLTQCTITNSHATVGTFVKILDGSTIIWEVYAAAVGGGAAATFPVPLRGTAATAVNCQPVTTGA